MEQVQVTFQGKTFTCNSLEQIRLGSRNDKWSIVIGGKNLDNTGLKKQNKIRKVNWSNWDVNPTFHDENIQPDSIVEVPGISYITQNYHSVDILTYYESTIHTLTLI